MSNPNPSPETRFKEGEIHNPRGRGKGKFSITTQIIKRLDDNPEQLKEILDWLIENRKDLVWQMIDSRPPQDLKMSGEIRLPLYLPSSLIEKRGLSQSTEENSE